MRRTFMDDDLQARFEDDGFVVLSLLSKDELERLRTLYEAAVPDRPQSGFTPVSYLIDIERGRALSRGAIDIVGHKILTVLLDYRLAVAAFLVKSPGGESALSPHCDPSIVDEDRFRSVVAWMALSDVDEQNGCVWILPGTHRATPRYRGRDVFAIQEAISQAGGLKTRRYIPLEAGQVLMFHHSLIHGSDDNRTEEPRIALQIYALPQESDALQCWINPEGKMERYRVRDDFHLDIARDIPPDGELIDVIERDAYTLSRGRMPYLQRVRRRIIRDRV